MKRYSVFQFFFGVKFFRYIFNAHRLIVDQHRQNKIQIAQANSQIIEPSLRLLRILSWAESYWFLKKARTKGLFVSFRKAFCITAQLKASYIPDVLNWPGPNSLATPSDTHLPTYSPPSPFTIASQKLWKRGKNPKLFQDSIMSRQSFFQTLVSQECETP